MEFVFKILILNSVEFVAVSLFISRVCNPFPEKITWSLILDACNWAKSVALGSWDIPDVKSYEKFVCISLKVFGWNLASAFSDYKCGVLSMFFENIDIFSDFSLIKFTESELVHSLA